MEIDLSKLPRRLETREDYKHVCENFVLPFMHEKAEKIAATIERLQAAIDKGDLEQEELDNYVCEIREHSMFASEDSPMAPFFKRLIALEKRLEEEGAFTEEDE